MSEQNRTRGVMYVAWGKAHVDVARRSAASVKRFNPAVQGRSGVRRTMTPVGSTRALSFRQR